MEVNKEEIKEGSMFEHAAVSTPLPAQALALEENEQMKRPSKELDFLIHFETSCLGCPAEERG